MDMNTRMMKKACRVTHKPSFIRGWRKARCRQDRLEIGITAAEIDLIAEEVLDMFRCGEWECDGVTNIRAARVFTKAALYKMVRDINRYPITRLNGAYREPGAFEAGAEAVWVTLPGRRLPRTS